MISNKLKYFFLVLSTFVILLFFSSVSINQSANSSQEISSYSTSWVGNSFGGGYTSDYWVQIEIEDIAVHSDGRVFTASQGDEGKKDYGIYKDGAIWDNGNRAWNGTGVGAIGSSTKNRPRGNAVALHPTQDYLYAPNYFDRNTVGRWNFNGSKTNFNVNVGFEPQGLAANENYLLVSGEDRVMVFDIKTGVFIRKWNLHSAGKLTFDRQGNIWAIAGTQIREYSEDGLLKQTIKGFKNWNPSDIDIDHLGRLMIADNGSSHLIRFYDIEDSLKQVDTLGVEGGIKAGIPGEVLPNKFWGITGCGADAKGNIYVALSEHGTVIRSFKPSHELKWELYGLHFVDVINANPTSDGRDLYGVQEHYVMDYSKPNGKQWILKGYTLDSDSYPEDPRRFVKFMATPWLSYINGQKFMYVTDMRGEFLQIYRFQGEVAIPSGTFSPRPQDWAANSPSASWIWSDNNGDGKFNSNEYLMGDGISQWRWWVSEDGTVWNTSGTKIYQYPPQGLDENGSPIYTFSSRVIIDAPLDPNWTDIQRTNYDADNDEMYISGYTTEYPINKGKFGMNRSMGPIIACYRDWSTNKNTPEWSIVLDHNYSAISWENQLQPRSFAIADDYMFVVYESFGLSSSDVTESRGEVDVYRLSDGNKVGYMLPTREIGGPPPTPNNKRPTIVGAVDVVQGIQAVKRSNGEYLVFVEEDKWAKVFFYRWNAPG